MTGPDSGGVTPLEAAARKVADSNYAEWGCHSTRCPCSDECECVETARAALTAAIEALPEVTLQWLVKPDIMAWEAAMCREGASYEDAVVELYVRNRVTLRRAFLGET